MNPDKISKFIYELRKEKGLSQYQLADMIPITRQAVSKWERGKTIPDSSTLIRLSEIFDVSINELLKGERLENNSIKELESTTLSIVDEHNKKKEETKKIIKAFLISTSILLFIFFIYYYINTINSIKVYTINGKSDHFVLHEGMFITTKQKSYLKLGKIIINGDYTINNIKVYYQDNKEKVLIFEDHELDKTIRNRYGYEEYFKQTEISKIIKNTFIEITYNENQTETISLNYERDFINSWSLFTKKREKEEKKIEGKNLELNIEEKAVNYIMENGELIDNSYVINIEDNIETLRFYYKKELNQLIFETDKKTKWISIPKKSSFCPEEKNTEKCSEIIKKDINKYLFNIE